ncbi:MAG: MATE family efflux transporter [Myxococcota bacterium]
MSQVGHHFLGFTDTFLAGKVDATTLGSVSIGHAVYFSTAVLGMGMMMGLDAVASQTLGANRSRAGRRALWQGIYIALVATVPLAALMLIVSQSLPLFGVVPALGASTAEYIQSRVFSLTPFMCLIACRSYLQASQVTRPVVFSVVVANVLNIIADSVALFGDDALLAVGLPALGLPRLGAFGVGISSTMASIAQVLVLAWAVRVVPVAPGPRSFRRPDRELIRRVLRVGGPVSLQLFAEVFIFAATGVVMGTLGAEVAAAHQVALIYASLAFSICVGIGAAASVLVGRAVGAGDHVAARRSGLATLVLAAGVMSVSATLMVTSGGTLSRFVIDEPEVIPLSEQLLLIAAVFQLVDGVQAVSAGALRGAGVTRFSLGANVLGHWAVGIPVGFTLAFPLGLGPVGLWWGLTAGLTCVAIALTAKFLKVTSRPIESVVDATADD